MSLVVFPFKSEDPDVVGSNLEVAISHDRVSEVWGVAAEDGAPLETTAGTADRLSSEYGKPLSVFSQNRLGLYRPGKGDGMNTALQKATARGFDRIHFYDADITNFDRGWIDGAEAAADRGYEIVRHRFPRAATDAMITWMVTRPALAMLFPGTVLPRLGQPLGGELLISGNVARALTSDELVRTRSDWGIDTVMTYATAALGAPTYEHNVSSGKRHALYGSLDEIRAMVIECLDAVRSLSGRAAPPDNATFEADPPAPVPDELKDVVGYDIESTMALLSRGWADGEMALARQLPAGVVGDVIRTTSEPEHDFMDADRWGTVLRWLLDNFEMDNGAWEALAFRLWLIRVLAYTSQHVPAGYDAAIEYLEGTIRRYEQMSLPAATWSAESDGSE